MNLIYSYIKKVILIYMNLIFVNLLFVPVLLLQTDDVFYKLLITKSDRSIKKLLLANCY